MGWQKFEQEIAVFHEALSVQMMGKLVDEAFRNSLDTLCQVAGGDAAAVWIVDPKNLEELVIAVNVGEKGSSIEGQIRQPLDTGLVSRAFRENQFICDQGAFRDPEQSLQVDMKLGQLTAYQMASPFVVFDKTVGAVTVIQLSNSQTNREWGFNESAIEAFQRWVPVGERLLEHAAIKEF